MSNNRKRGGMGSIKSIIFTLVILLLLAGLAELVSRVAYYQTRHSPNQSPFAVVESFNTLQKYLARKKAHNAFGEIKNQRDLSDRAWNVLFSDEGNEVRQAFFAKYENHFTELVKACKKYDTQLVVLYIPSYNPAGRKADSEKYCRPFFQQLANRHDTGFVDATDSLRSHEFEAVTLMPINGHLSRFGNRLVAAELSEALEQYKQFQTGHTYDGNPEVCGDQVPGTDRVSEELASMPYRIKVDRHGFRQTNEGGLEIPKKRTRVLVLGDSFTLGPYLPGHDTFPAFLQQMRPGLEVVNAGYVGYTIDDEASLFIEKARHIAPDITLLQVLDNDITGLLSFRKNVFDRKRRHHEPSAEEEALVQMLKAGN